jgi:MFS family permease
MANHAPGPLAVCIAGALALAAAIGIGRFDFTPMLPIMIGAGQVDVAAGGWIAAANYAGYLAGALVAPRLPWGPQRLGVLALSLTLALSASMALPAGVIGWSLLRFAAGVASAWVFVSTAVWCLGALARMERTAWAGAVYAGVGSGIALAGLHGWAGGIAGLSPAAMWLQLALLGLVLTMPVLYVLGRLGGDAPAPHAAATSASAAPGAAVPPPGTLGLVICYGLFGFGYILPATFIPVLARDVVPDPRLFGLAWPVFGAMAALSTFLAARLARRFSRLQAWAFAQALMALGVLLPSLWASGAAIGLSAVLVGGTFMVITMLGVQEIRARNASHPTRWVARMTTAFALGQIAGPMVSSLLLHLPPHMLHGLNGLDLALQAAAVALAASSAWLWREAAHSTTTRRMSHAR